MRRVQLPNQSSFSSTKCRIPNGMGVVARATILFLGVLGSLAIFAEPNPYNDRPGKICFVTIGSDDEKRAFQSSLRGQPNPFTNRPYSDSDFEELFPAGSVGSGESWLDAACQRGVQCDSLVISGHFGMNNFFVDRNGESNGALDMRNLEQRSCSRSCQGIIQRPLEVLTFSCRVVAGKLSSQRDADQYRRRLMREGQEDLGPHDVIAGSVRAQVAMDAMDPTNPTNSYLQYTQRVFPNSVGGCVNAAPLGSNAVGATIRSMNGSLQPVGGYGGRLQELQEWRAARLANQAVEVLSAFNRHTSRALSTTSISERHLDRNCRFEFFDGAIENTDDDCHPWQRDTEGRCPLIRSEIKNKICSLMDPNGDIQAQTNQAIEMMTDSSTNCPIEGSAQQTCADYYYTSILNFFRSERFRRSFRDNNLSLGSEVPSDRRALFVERLSALQSRASSPNMRYELAYMKRIMGGFDNLNWFRNEEGYQNFLRDGEFGDLFLAGSARRSALTDRLCTFNNEGFVDLRRTREDERLFPEGPARNCTRPWPGR